MLRPSNIINVSKKKEKKSILDSINLVFDYHNIEKQISIYVRGYGNKENTKSLTENEKKEKKSKIYYKICTRYILKKS